MRPVSTRYLQALRGSHGIAVRARACPPGQTGIDPDGTDIPIIEGSVELDADAEVRATLDLTTAATWPIQPNSRLLPYGNELFVERAVEYGDGSREWVSLGYYRIETLEQEQPPNGPIRITARDRMAGLIDARMTQPLQFTRRHTIAQIVERLVHDVYPAAEIDYDFDPHTIALGRRSSVVEEDRHRFLTDLVQALGRDWSWDHRGHLRIQAPPRTDDPVWTVDHGHDGVLVELRRQISREDAYNGVVVIGESTDDEPPVRAVVVDQDPRSPTYWHGPYGHVPEIYTNHNITTRREADRVARERLARYLGLTSTLDLTLIPNPALEALDPIRVTYAEDRAPETHVLQRLTIPLTPDDAMAATTKSQPRLLIGDPTYAIR